MPTSSVLALAAIAVVALSSLVIGLFGVRFARNTSDFLQASRTTPTAVNASAISGEYLSAASFLGVAGLILKDGPDALWYPVGFTAGYLALLLFVAAPFRRSGAYSVPDFVDFRLRSPALSRVCAVVVVVIGWLYLLPQLQGAGLTLATVAPMWPSWIGVVVAASVVVLSVVVGAMRSITFVQAFQFWLKFTALTIPAIALVLYIGADHRPLNRPAPPQFLRETVVTVETDVNLEVTQPVTFKVNGVIDGMRRSEPARWSVGQHTVGKGTTLIFPAGTSVPTPVGFPVRDSGWLTPLSGEAEHQMFAIYSLIMATFLGTMGLPHLLVRFYTNTDGRSARRTAVYVVGLLGAFYLLPEVLGVLSRLYVPQLLVSGDSDAAVLLLPTAVLGNGWFGTSLATLVAAGAWAAFLSTSSGLVMSVSGVLSSNLFPRGGVRDLRVAAVLAGAVPLALALTATRLDFSQTVSLAFAVAASTFCPLMFLGIWWAGLTDRGAIAGLVVGGVSSVTAALLSLFDVVPADGWIGLLVARPAAVTVPAAFVTMVVVSRLTAKRLLPDVSRLMLRLHAPERLGLSQERVGRSG
ncbi:MAG TPA: cation acetate symporter [Pseudonocardia sp.]